MSTRVFRFTSLHHNVDREIRFELMKRVPNALRLFRLRRLRQVIKARLSRILGRELKLSMAR